MKEFEPRAPIQLPAGWNSELITIDQEITERTTQMDILKNEMDAEIERIKESYLPRIRELNPIQLSGLKEEAWQKVRDTYPIPHPTRIEEFQHPYQAAEVLAHYWLEEFGQTREDLIPMTPNELIRNIAGYGPMPWVNGIAAEYARHLTQPSSPERDYVEKAQQFLWKDYSK